MRVWAATCHLYFYDGTTGVERIPRQDRVSTESKPRRRKFCRLSCWGSNPQPCDHQSGPLPQNCIPWAIYAHVINKSIQMPKVAMHHTGSPFLLSTFQSAKHAMFGLAAYYDHSRDTIARSLVTGLQCLTQNRVKDEFKCFHGIREDISRKSGLVNCRERCVTDWSKLHGVLGKPDPKGSSRLGRQWIWARFSRLILFTGLTRNKEKRCWPKVVRIDELKSLVRRGKNLGKGRLQSWRILLCWMCMLQM